MENCIKKRKRKENPIQNNQLRSTHCFERRKKNERERFDWSQSLQHSYFPWIHPSKTSRQKECWWFNKQTELDCYTNK